VLDKIDVDPVVGVAEVVAADVALREADEVVVP
jgi:hypothetical protein